MIPVLCNSNDVTVCKEEIEVLPMNSVEIVFQETIKYLHVDFFCKM